MNIIKVILSNIDMIYESCNDIIKSKEFANMMCGNKVSYLYDTAKIELNIENINTYEYAMLKIFSNGNISDFICTEEFSRSYISNTYPELFNSGKIGDALNDIEAYMNEGHDIYKVVPFGFTNIGKCCVKFSGNSIIHFLGTDPVINFKKYMENDQLKDYKEIEDDLKNDIQEKFINTFYTFMEKYICEKDIISEYGLYTKIIQPEYLRLNTPSLIDVSNTNLYASAISRPQSFKSDIEQYKLSEYYNPDKLNDTVVTFRLKVRMNHFIKLINLLKISNIKYHTNLLIAYEKSVVEIRKVIDNYDVISAVAYIRSSLEKDCNDLRKYINTTPCSNISMILSFSLKETFELVNKKNSITKDKYLYEILEIIINNLSVIHNSLV